MSRALAIPMLEALIPLQFAAKAIADADFDAFQTYQVPGKCFGGTMCCGCQCAELIRLLSLLLFLRVVAVASCYLIL